MNVLKKAWAVGIAGALLLVISPAVSWAAQQTTAAIPVTASIPVIATVEVVRDPANSVPRFSAMQIVFDRLDINDGQPDGNAGFMYAPYRSEVNKNWHLLQIFGNGGNTSLTAAVNGTVGNVQLSTLLNVFCGGYFPVTGGGPNANTKSGDWEPLNGFSRPLSRPFIGTAPFNYRLKAFIVPAGTYTGTITFTLTST